MFCAENLTSFTGNIMSILLQEESAVLTNLGGQNFKILSGTSHPTMVGLSTLQTIWRRHIERCINGPDKLI